MASALGTVTEVTDKVETGEDETWDYDTDTRGSATPSSDLRMGSADYNTASGNVGMEVPYSPLSSFAPPSGGRSGLGQAQLSMSAQTSVRNMMEQVKSRAVFGQPTSSTTAGR